MSEKSSQTLIFVLLAVGGIFLLCAVLCVAGGIFAFRGAVKEARAVAQTSVIKLEIDNMANAFEMYRALHYDYPPNFDQPGIVDVYFRKAFPRFNAAAEGITPPPIGLDAAEALVFWLQGYSSNPVDPLAPGQRTGLFNFDPTRLRDDDGDMYPAYYPPGGEVPYVYIEERAYESAVFKPEGGVHGAAQAYRSDSRGAEYSRPNGFQIICAGADNHYGQGGSHPGGAGYSDQDLDNITNFSTGTLGDDTANALSNQ